MNEHIALNSSSIFRSNNRLNPLVFRTNGDLPYGSKMRWGLRKKLIVWLFLPTALILFAVALVTFFAYQRVTEELVMERNQELTRLFASQYAGTLDAYSDRLDTLSRSEQIGHEDPVIQQTAVLRASNKLALFDGGLVIVDAFGSVVATAPERPEIIGKSWSNRPYIRELRQTLSPTASNLTNDGFHGSESIGLAAPIIGPKGVLTGAIIGFLRLESTEANAFQDGIARMSIGDKGSAYIVDRAGRVLYHSGGVAPGTDLSDNVAVRNSLAGQVGVEHMNGSARRNIVAGYAPIPDTTWGLIIEEDWQTLMDAGQRHLQLPLLLLLLGLVIPSIVVAIGVRRITQPLTELTDAAERIADGNFSRTFIQPTGDEVQSLAEQFNKMAMRLQQSYAQLEQRVGERTKELSALNKISVAVSQSLELNQTLDSALTETLNVMDIEAGGIYLLADSEENLTLAAHKGLEPSLVEEINTLQIGEGFSGRVVSENRTIVANNLARDARLSSETMRKSGMRSIAAIPLRSKEQVVGTIFAITHKHREFTEQDIELLTSIGHQVGIAVDHALLYEKAQKLAAREERGRLARELHDSVTQSLYSLTLLAEGWRRMADQGELDDPREPLAELGQLGQQALKEMRLLVYELRPPALEHDGLVTALQQRLSAVEKRSGVETTMEAQELWDLPQEVEDGVYRIAQEALNNTLKHAAATEVSVAIREGGSKLTVQIADNGNGFDLKTVRNTGGMGLANMRERCRQLNGVFNLKTKPGNGTIIDIQIPLFLHGAAAD